MSNAQIGICGPTGSGKSTLLRMLRLYGGWNTMPEPRPVELLNAVANGLTGAGFSLQKHFILASSDLPARYGSDVTVIDRTLLETREVFLPLHHSLGNISDEELDELTELSLVQERLYQQLHFAICLCASESTLHFRMDHDLDHRRPKWLIDSLHLQLGYYSGIELKFRCPYIKIDTTFSTELDLETLANWCLANAVHPPVFPSVIRTSWGGAKLLASSFTAT